MTDDDRIAGLMQAFVDGELDAAGAEELLLALRHDRTRLAEVEALEHIAETARALQPPPLPALFVERAMERVRSGAAPRRRFAVPRVLQRRFEFSLAHLGMATLALVFVAGSIGFSQGRDEGARATTASPAGDAELVRFTLRADAQSVELAGSFNGWSPAPLERRPDGTFEAVLPLAKGRHEYAFRVDGSWQPDPLAKAAIDDGFGGSNSVIEL